MADNPVVTVFVQSLWDVLKRQKELEDGSDGDNSDGDNSDEERKSLTPKSSHSDNNLATGSGSGVEEVQFGKDEEADLEAAESPDKEARLRRKRVVGNHPL